MRKVLYNTYETETWRVKSKASINTFGTCFIIYHSYNKYDDKDKNKHALSVQREYILNKHEDRTC